MRSPFVETVLIYLSGHIDRALVGIRADLGVMASTHGTRAVDLTTTPWALDNGCFRRPETFNCATYVGWLKTNWPARRTCLFATAPDVVGDAAATLRLALPVLKRIRAEGFPAAFVAQDGLEAGGVPWHAFDVLFIGGSTGWKLSHHAKLLTREARDRGKAVHMGRVNSLLRIRTAAMWGCTSCDGTFLAFGPDKNTPRLIGFLDAHRSEPVLNFGGPQ